MINENDFYDILNAVEKTNHDNIGCIVTCAKIRELVKHVIDRRIDDMAKQYNKVELQKNRDLSATYYRLMKKKGANRKKILDDILFDKKNIDEVYGDV